MKNVMAAETVTIPHTVPMMKESKVEVWNLFSSSIILTHEFENLMMVQGHFSADLIGQANLVRSVSTSWSQSPETQVTICRGLSPHL